MVVAFDDRYASHQPNVDRDAVWMIEWQCRTANAKLILVGYVHTNIKMETKMIGSAEDTAWRIYLYNVSYAYNFLSLNPISTKVLHNIDLTYKFYSTNFYSILTHLS